MGTALAAQGETRVRGEHYEVVCDFNHPAVARRALEAVEATWPMATALYGAAPGELATPLVVHLYRNPKAYAEAEDKLTRGRFRRNLAFAHYASRTAHVAVQPLLTDEALDRVGLTFQTLRLLIHEAAHLARYRTIPNHRSHPGWFADGNATWIEEQVLTELGELAGIEEDPSFCAKITLAQKLVARHAMPSVAEILHGDTKSLTFHESYAVRWLLFRLLMGGEYEPALRHTIERMAEFGEGAKVADRCTAAIRRGIGAQEFAGLDRLLVRYIAQLSPQWEEVHRTLDTSGEAWVQAAFESSDAVAWRTEPLDGRSFALSGAVTVLGDGSNQLNLLLDRRETGFLAVSFAAGQGVTVSRYRAGDEQWDTLREVRLPALQTDRRIPFLVSYSTTAGFSIDINRQRVLTMDLDRPMSGPWGLGARAGSTGLWHAVKLSARR